MSSMIEAPNVQKRFRAPKPVARLIRCHPRAALAILLAADGTITLWDLRSSSSSS